MRPFLALVSALTLPLFAPAGVAWACSCAVVHLDLPGPAPTEDELLSYIEELNERSELFVGTVLTVDHVRVSLPHSSRSELLLVATLEVQELWIGERAWRKEVYTSAHTSACGVSFEVGESYVVESDRIEWSDLRGTELPRGASWAERCRTTPYSPEGLQESTAWLPESLPSWSPTTERVALEP